MRVLDHYGHDVSQAQHKVGDRPQGVGLRTVLGATGFRRLVAVRLTGQFTDGMVQAALATYVLFSPERAATPAKVAISFAVLLLPYSLIGPFVGVLLDRWRRRQVLLCANLIRALLVIWLATVVARGDTGITLALTVLVVLGVNRFILSALSAGTPHVVPADYLVTANAIAPTLGTGGTVVGGLVGVGLREAAGANDHASVVVLAVVVVLYAAAGLLALRLQRDELGPARPDAGQTLARNSLGTVARGLVDGLRRLHERPRAWRAIGLIAAQRTTFGMGVALAVLQVRGALHPASQADAALRDLTVVIGVAGVGAFLGALLAPRMTKRFGAVRWSVAAMATGVCLGAVAVATASLSGLLLMGLFIGFGGQGAKVCTDAIVQTEIDDKHLGRVFSLYDMAVNVSIVIGLTYAVLVAPRDGRSLIVPATMALVALGAGALALRAERRENTIPQG